ncbi:MAG TPA: VOC family protein [Allosphingosinicella sp.]|nr:VOC family protein [Allosphingosinicella sp.]
MAIDYDGGLTCAINVAGLDKAIAWYRDILGFRLLYRRDDFAWCELATGVERVNVGLGENRERSGPGGATLTFGVRDMDSAKAALVAAGVRLDGEVREVPGMVRLLTFYDPDDNALMFYQALGAA